MAGIFHLKGTVKHYDWGGTHFIPELLDLPNETHKPFAEYWMGIHPQGISTIDIPDGGCRPLTQWTESLSYLLKILDVKDMLSIQVHPSKKEAEKGFTYENAAGVPIDAPNRNYRDDNHKPELMLALGDFWLLHGFKPVEELLDTLMHVEELRDLLPLFNTNGYAALYRHVMEMPQEEVNHILKPLVQKIVPLYNQGKLKKGEEDHWVARAAITFDKGENIDRGIFSIYLFNIVHLKKGEAIFQDAGVPHAYLEGQNVEIMANSDNVLRGGLTTKHIDVNELLTHTKCEATWPDIMEGVTVGKEKLYKTPVPDFELSSFELNKDESIELNPVSTEILLLLNGELHVSATDNEPVILKKGKISAVLLPGQSVTLRADSHCLVFRAKRPV